MVTTIESSTDQKSKNWEFRIPHEFFEEAYRSPYPHSPLPGVSAERMDISRVGKRAPHLPPDVEKFAVELAQLVNLKLAVGAQTLQPGKSNEYMTMLKTPDETERIISRAVYAVFTVAMKNPTVPIVCPPADGTPLGRLLTFMGIPDHRIHSIEIKGTTGMQTGHAQVESGPLPEELRQKNAPSLLFDLLPDSGVTTAAYALDVLKAKYPSEYTWEAEASLRERLVAANKNDNHGAGVYLELAQTCARADVVPVFVLTKNLQITLALRQTLAEFPGVSPAWRNIMNAVIEAYPEYPGTPMANVWGIGPFDTGVKLSRIRGYFKGKRLWNHPLFKKGIREKHSGQDTDNEWLLRLGLVPGLEYLDKVQEENIVGLAARTFEWMTKREK